mmetsp:Transcript_121576/g.238860  ORF Transcript_121576/g.238860 Transcript_121576/m.238860 type:complete len:305 (+) Transcript_121576:3-917(+)
MSGPRKAGPASDLEHDAADLRALIPWLLKDLGWVLLLWPLAFAAAVFGVAVDVAVLRATWPRASAGERAHLLSEVLWLTGNTVWMASELLFEDKPPEVMTVFRPLTWYGGPLRHGVNADSYVACVAAARACMVLALAIIGVFYCGCALGAFSLRASFGEREVELPFFGRMSAELYAHAFMVPWVFKDICWTWDWGHGVAVAAVLAGLLAADSMRRFRAPLFAAELLWLAGNSMWAFVELGLQDMWLSPRLTASSLITASLALAVLEAAAALQIAGNSAERRPLIVGGMCAPPVAASCSSEMQQA